MTWAVIEKTRQILRLEFLFFFSFSFFFFKFLDRGEGREKERERNINVWLPLSCPPPRTWHATQACALTGDHTTDPLLHRLELNPLRHSRQGWSPYSLMSYVQGGISKFKKSS